MRLINGEEELQKILDIRKRVFIEEQGVSEKRERDGLEDKADQFIVLDDEKEIGCARIRFIDNKAKLERIAILPEYRRKGLGKKLVNYLIDYSKNKGVKEIYLHGQVRIQKFYEGLGFKARGDIFIDGGMEHYEFYMRV